jgi:phosphate transport system permease protein
VKNGFLPEPSSNGVKPLIYGTLWVSFGAIILALPIVLAAAIYLRDCKEKNS